MEFFNKVAGMAKSAAKTAGEKTEELIESGKINLKIGEEKNKIKELKTKLGEYIWQEYLKGTAMTDEPQALCQEIAGIEELISELNQKLAALKAEKGNPEE